MLTSPGPWLAESRGYRPYCSWLLLISWQVDGFAVAEDFKPIKSFLLQWEQRTAILAKYTVIHGVQKIIPFWRKMGRSPLSAFSLLLNSCHTNHLFHLNSMCRLLSVALFSPCGFSCIRVSFLSFLCWASSYEYRTDFANRTVWFYKANQFQNWKVLFWFVVFILEHWIESFLMWTPRSLLALP